MASSNDHVTAALECLARDLEAARDVLTEIRDHAQGSD